MVDNGNYSNIPQHNIQQRPYSLQPNQTGSLPAGSVQNGNDDQWKRSSDIRLSGNFF